MEIFNWNDELKHFEEVWVYRRDKPVVHTNKLWNARADEWENELHENPEKRKRSESRVNATVEYLSNRGLLKPNDEVIDIGCGPGRFVAGFAKKAKHVVGSDISQRMCEHGEAFAHSQDIYNISYIPCDFTTVNIDDLGWRKKFDLVFTSITPAISGEGGLEKLMSISREWCFNSCFVNTKDPLADEIRKTLFDLEPNDERCSYKHWYYALVNLLFIQGYYPETYYYTEVMDEYSDNINLLTDRYSQHIDIELGISEQEVKDKVKNFLINKADTDGRIHRENSCSYGWALWNVNGIQC